MPDKGLRRAEMDDLFFTKWLGAGFIKPAVESSQNPTHRNRRDV